MTFIKNILGRIFAFWAIISFVALFLVIFIPSQLCWLLPDPKGQKLFIAIARLWMNIWIPLTGCRFRIKGKEHFKKGEAYIVACNHNSMMDIPLSSAFIPGANKTIAKSSFTKVPLFGIYYIKGSVLVDRKNEQSRRQSFEKMKKVLQKGIHMCIYPEGTRNRTADPLKKFHDGAFRLSADTSVPIIPAIILNTKKVVPVTKPFYFWPGKIEMHFLEPVSPVGLTADELKSTIFNRMKEYYLQHQH
ncbi:MAG: 1-acyl-sn-glycerol-3-phosphate acyltransferase [Chitinophagaceae bacterium]|nr:1-acyl-sn-glycerol-3-phosphate acyltransferase [Chitinophagaceae bacterium]